MPVLNVATDLVDWCNDPLRVITAHLAKNDQADALGELTLANLVECDYAGYAPQTVSGFTFDPENNDEVAHATADAVEFISGNVVAPQRASIVYYTEEYDGGESALLKWLPLLPVATIDRAGIKITQVMEAWASDWY